MQNQFFYTRREIIKGDGEISDTYRDFKDSINMSKIIRSLTMEDNRVLLLMDDIHERITSVPVIDHKTNRVKSYNKERGVFQSEIYLSDKGDIKRFYKATSID